MTLGIAIDSYYLIIAASIIIIFSFLFGEISKRTNVPSVLLLIVLGIVLKLGLDYSMGEQIEDIDFQSYLPLLGTVGLVMIVLEAALELKLEKDKYIPIAKALGIALIGLLAAAYAAAFILHKFIPGMDWQKALIYATPISILSSAIIIPSVTGLREDKKEFHIYESTFSDILGIMMFTFLVAPFESESGGSGAIGFGINVLITIAVSLIASYIVLIGFQRIRSHVKLFLLIAVLLLLYAVAKKMHLSSLLIILVFGLMIANMKLFFKGATLSQFYDKKKVDSIYEGLHVVTLETAFVVRTFFFVVFGLSIVLSSLLSLRVALISVLIIASIYITRYLILRLFIGKDINPQLYIAPRGLITILLFYAIPDAVIVPEFQKGILLFIIIGTSLIMTIAMIMDKRRTNSALRVAKNQPVGYVKWEAPSVAKEEEGHNDAH